jgi:hypothetical protein
MLTPARGSLLKPERWANRYSPPTMARAPTTESTATTQKSIASMHSPLSLAVGYNRIGTHGRRSCNNVATIFAKDKTSSLCSRCRTPTSILSSTALGGPILLRGLRFAPRLRSCGLWVTMPGGGTRPGEEVRDGPHNNNRCGGNRCGVAPTAAPLSPRAEAFGLQPLYWPRPRFLNVARRGLCFAPSPRCAGASVVRTYLPPVGRAHLRKHATTSPCSAHRLLSWGRSFLSLLGSGPSLCPVPMP